MNKAVIKNIKLMEFGSSFGTRELGKKIRVEVEEFIQQGCRIMFDFKGVHMISSAFADEIFGKLFIIIGEEEFKSRVKINGFDNEEDKKVILFLIQKGISFRKDEGLQ
ncbi:STAS-like domain-containing protein [Candidatus Omnitrophota bacterium]